MASSEKEQAQQLTFEEMEKKYLLQVEARDRLEIENQALKGEILELRTKGEKKLQYYRNAAKSLALLVSMEA